MSNESYVPAHLAIVAMRDNGYKNTAYAVAELMDNAIQAEATCVQLLCAEKEEELATRKTKRLYQIAVLDNGKGMDSKVLKMALQFGNGTRLGKDQRKGIGRFGMGLPASSISQCRRVDVWTWQNGIENSLHTYLDIDDIMNGHNDTIPEPSSKPLPEIWSRTGIEFGATGTLVVWSKLDRLMWSKAYTLIENSESLIGSMYRKFLNEGKVKIRLAAFLIDDLKTFTIDKLTLPNDPGYLMEKTTCPAPFNDKPMFNPFGDKNYERQYSINFQGEAHEVCVRFSIAKDEARANDNAGGTPYGKHASKNIGVSIVRAGRELDLDQSLVIKYDTTERWWGIEIEFPPPLDELMGVTNNKQFARNFADVMSLDIESLLKSGKTLNQVIAEMEEEGDPRAPLIEMTNDIKNQVITMRRLIKEQKKGSGGSRTKRHNINPEKTATELTNQRKQDGFAGTSDIDDEKPKEEKEQEITAELVESGIDQQTAEQLAANTVSNNLKYLFAETPFEADAFFTVRPRGGAINIILNTRHPAYEHLVEVLNEETIDDDAKVLRERLEKASEGLKLLLMAWARYEDELSAGQRKDQAQDTRNDWGRVAKSFLKEY